jgi:2-methylcitrate dehydratase PrpD
MSDATTGAGASESLAHFVAGPHDGAAFDEAVREARECLLAARAAAQTTTVPSPFGVAFATATAIAASLGRQDATIVAAALASGELAGCTEAGIIEAIAIGREVAARLQRALTLDAPWDAVAVAGGVGAATAAARAASLGATATQHAIGLAATQAAGLGVIEGTPAGALACGKTAADAVEAALLARHGFTAAAASLEGRRGLAALMASSFDETALRPPSRR